MVEGGRGVDEDDSFDGMIVCEEDLGGAEGDDATKGPACTFAVSWRWGRWGALERRYERVQSMVREKRWHTAYDARSSDGCGNFGCVCAGHGVQAIPFVFGECLRV